ncbi:putative transmembrane protein [Wenzhou Myotis laniger paramyxovirus 2]|uniref:Transmembrane protein n=1 Tax=Wenzhou Myotis laniger paramyxovirus 2 TaxID=2928980 RepID=A0A8T9KLI6_9MONO|nr:putative transmembrane protein [Wenzhou Myotis laniger paramyxovirus 2]
MDRGNHFNFNNTFNFHSNIRQDPNTDTSNIYEPVNYHQNITHASNMPLNHTHHHSRYGVYHHGHDQKGNSCTLNNCFNFIIVILLTVMISINLWFIVTVRSISNEIGKTKYRNSLPKPLPIEDEGFNHEVIETTLRTILRDTAYTLPQLIKDNSCLSQFRLQTKSDNAFNMDVDFEMILDSTREDNINHRHRERVNIKIDMKNHTRGGNQPSLSYPTNCDKTEDRGNCLHPPDRDKLTHPDPSPTRIPSQRPRGPPGSRGKLVLNTCREMLVNDLKLNCMIKDHYLRELRKLFTRFYVVNTNKPYCSSIH